MLTALGTVLSGHCPLLVDLDVDFALGRRFQFECFWPKAEGFQQVVQDAWDEWKSFYCVGQQVKSNYQGALELE